MCRRNTLNHQTNITPPIKATAALNSLKFWLNIYPLHLVTKKKKKKKMNAYYGQNIKVIKTIALPGKQLTIRAEKQTIVRLVL